LVLPVDNDLLINKETSYEIWKNICEKIAEIKEYLYPRHRSGLKGD
jgi:hypothetical protein